MPKLAKLTYELSSGLLATVMLTVFPFTKRGKPRLKERLGRWNLPNNTSYIWIHGASVGELRGLIPTIPTLKSIYPDSKILITSFSAKGIETFGKHGDESRLLPFDVSLLISSALKGIEIKCFIFGETEIWPSLMDYLKSNSVPSILVNGRIEPKGYNFYKKLSCWFSPAIKTLTAAIVTSEKTKEKLITLGLDKNKIFIAPNLKYDIAKSLENNEQITDFANKNYLANRRIICLGSVHPTEETGWIKSFKDISLKDQSLLLVVAPRHLEKISQFKSTLSASGLNYCLFSEYINPKSEINRQNISCILLDTFGNLEKFYAVSELAFVGGTLVDIGGHNPFEPAKYGVPVAVGSYRSKILSEIQILQEHGGVINIENESDISNLLLALINDPNKIKSIGKLALKASESVTGGTAIVQDILLKQLRNYEKAA